MKWIGILVFLGCLNEALSISETVKSYTGESRKDLFEVVDLLREELSQLKVNGKKAIATETDTTSSDEYSDLKEDGDSQDSGEWVPAKSSDEDNFDDDSGNDELEDVLKEMAKE